MDDLAAAGRGTQCKKRLFHSVCFAAVSSNITSFPTRRVPGLTSARCALLPRNRRHPAAPQGRQMIGLPRDFSGGLTMAAGRSLTVTHPRDSYLGSSVESGMM